MAWLISGLSTSSICHLAIGVPIIPRDKTAWCQELANWLDRHVLPPTLQEITLIIKGERVTFKGTCDLLEGILVGVRRKVEVSFVYNLYHAERRWWNVTVSGVPR